MKDGVHRQYFPSNYAIIAAVKEWVMTAGADFYKRRMQALDHCWQKCITNDGDYDES